MARLRETQSMIADRRHLSESERGPGVSGGGSPAVALVYPNTYHVGMSSLGFQIAMQSVAACGGRAERFFIDTFAQGSIESGAPASNFDAVAISATYELDDPYIVDAIEWAGLPLLARERGASRPLVVMGGLLASVNRLPVYPFIDIFAFGDAERIMPELIELIALEKSGEIERRELLERLSEKQGFEITNGAKAAVGLDEVEIAALRPAFIDPLDGAPCASALISPHTEFSEMGLIDLARGCPHHCTFCWIGHHSPCYRVRPAGEILKAAQMLSAYTDRLGLVASAVGAHPEIDAICDELTRRGMKISYSSLRVEDVSPTMLRALAAGGQKSVTIAPEAGSERVRKLLGKPITDEKILAVIEEIFGLGAESLKMYFMTGVPTETDDEALEIAAFVEKVRAVQLKWSRPRGRMGTLGINLGIFVPKPGLPLLKLEPVPLAASKKRLGKVVRALEKIPNTHVNASSPDLALAQSILSMGGIDAAEYVLAARKLKLDWRAANRQWKSSGRSEL